MKLTTAILVVALAVAAAQACTFTCPDATCATSLANCSCTANAGLSAPNAIFDRNISTWVATQTLNGAAYAHLAVDSGNCSEYDFTPFVKYTWNLQFANGSSAFSANGSSVAIPPRTMAPATSYTLVLTAHGLVSTQSRSTNYTVSAVASTPRVSIAAGGSERRYSTLKPTVILASVGDDYPVASPSFTWACEPTISCPSLENHTASNLTIPAGTTAGQYRFTYTYRGVASKLDATFVAGAVPTVAVVQTSVPVVGQPLSIYLSTQNVSLSAAVSYAGNVTYSWYRGATNSSNSSAGDAIGSGRVLTLSAATLDPSGADNTMVENRFSVVVADATDSTVFGEAALIIYVLPAYDLTLTVTAAAAGMTSATALLDQLVLATTSQTLNEQSGRLPYGLGYQTTFSFLAGSAYSPLSATPSGSNYRAVAPIPAGNATGNATVTFQAELRIGGVLAAADTATFSIARPDAAAAAANLLDSAASITDPAAATAAAANIATLMETTTDPVLKAKLANAAMDMLTNSITSFDAQTSDQQAAIFDLCTSAVGSQTGSAAKAAAEAKTLSLMLLALASSSFDPKNGQAALKALASVSTSANSASALADLAAVLAKDTTIEAGTTRVYSANGVSLSAARELAADIVGFVTTNAGNSMTFPTGFALPDLLSTDTISVSSTSGANAYGGTPQGSVTSYNIAVGGVKRRVANLLAALIIKLAATSANSRCAYWDTTLNAWSTVGVTTRIVNGVVQCEATHLTAFATFASSASAVAAALPLLVAVLGVVFQAMM